MKRCLVRLKKMKENKGTVMIELDQEVYNSLQEDRKYFEKTIGMEFNDSDTVMEYQKILSSYKE